MQMLQPTFCEELFLNESIGWHSKTSQTFCQKQNQFFFLFLSKDQQQMARSIALKQTKNKSKQMESKCLRLKETKNIIHQLF